MRLTCFGHAAFALGLTGFGVLSLISGDFTYVWQLVPAWVPLRSVLAVTSSVLLIAGSVGLLWPRTLARASALLALYGLASMLLMHLPHIAQQPQEENRWFGLSEIAIIVAGAWILFAGAVPTPASDWRRAIVGERGVRLARLLFALALLPIGLSHFVYAELTASLVPAWLPGHLGWAYLTGAGHFAAALGMLAGVLPRLAVTLEALMVSTFVLTVHVPSILGAPRDADQWTELFVACTIGGVAFLIGHSYRSTGWLAIRPPRVAGHPD